MRILQVCPRSPVPPKDGGAQGMYFLAQGMREAGHEVRTLAIGAGDAAMRAQPFARQFPVRFVEPTPLWRSAPGALARGIPLSVAKYSTRALVAATLAMVREQPTDLVWFDHSQMAMAARAVKAATGLPVAVRAHNLEWKIFERNGANARSRLMGLAYRAEARRLKAFESRMGAGIDAIVSISQVEQAWFAEHNRDTRVLLMPAGYAGELPALRNLPGAPTILHVAPLDWVPNAEGLDWFLREVLPAVRLARPGVVVEVVGRNPPAALVRRHAGDAGIRFRGFVEDLEPFEAQAGCMIVPLKAGGGIRIKVLNALAQGIPVVSTAIGCEGIPVKDGVHALLADDPPGFARSVSFALAGGPPVESLRRTGRLLVSQDFAWPELIRRCMKELEPILGSGPAQGC